MDNGEDVERTTIQTCRGGARTDLLAIVSMSGYSAQTVSYGRPLNFRQYL